MNLVIIQNAKDGDIPLIQPIVNAYGFGPLAEVEGVLTATSPYPISATDMVALEDELLDDVGKHLAVSFK